MTSRARAVGSSRRHPFTKLHLHADGAPQFYTKLLQQNVQLDITAAELKLEQMQKDVRHCAEMRAERDRLVKELQAARKRRHGQERAIHDEIAWNRIELRKLQKELARPFREVEAVAHDGREARPLDAVALDGLEADAAAIDGLEARSFPEADAAAPDGLEAGSDPDLRD